MFLEQCLPVLGNITSTLLNHSAQLQLLQGLVFPLALDQGLKREVLVVKPKGPKLSLQVQVDVGILRLDVF